MKDDACEVMTGGIWPVKIPVQHVREPDEWVPVVGVIGCEGPLDTDPRQSFLHSLIRGDIKVVVKPDEIMPTHLLIDRQRRNHQKDCYNTSLLSVRKPGHTNPA